MKANEISIGKVSLGRLQDSNIGNSQKIAWINYDGNKKPLQLKTPLFATETYGIPRQGQYYQSDKDRSFYKLPFCHERAQISELDYSEIESFYNKLVELDQFFGSEERRVELFGEKNANKYEYQPIVRTPSLIEDEGEDEVDDGSYKPSGYRPPYMKVKLPLSFEKNVPLFQVWEKKVGGERREVALESFADVLTHMKFLSRHRMIMELQKVYAMKTNSGGVKKKYGVTVKLVAVECTNDESRVRSTPCVDMFDD